jgi:hypothetical protein
MSTRTKEAPDNRQRGEILTPNINMNLYLPLFFSHSFLCQLLLVRLQKKVDEQVMVSTPPMDGNGNEGAKPQ